MKKTLIFFIAVMLMNHICGQEMVIPNKPYLLPDQQPGYMTINDINLGAGLSVISVPFSKTFAGITSIHGYQIDNNFYAGAGTGILFYNGGPMLPLFLDVRYRSNYHLRLHNYFSRKGVQQGRSELLFIPFAYIDGGLLFHLSGDESGIKRFINAGLGLNYIISKNLTADFSAGLFSQFETLRDSFIRFRLGISYKLKKKH